MEGNYSYEINSVCVDCHDTSTNENQCSCHYQNYETIALEFKVCNCCGHTDTFNVPFTEFNRQQLGDAYFHDEIKEEELRSRVDKLNFQIASFRGKDQGINEVPVAVRVICLETKEITECSEHKSHYKNIEQAKRFLAMTELERAFEWYDDLSVHKARKMQSDYKILGHDQGVNQDDILEMYKLYKDEH
jgi:hypothetical protein